MSEFYRCTPRQVKGFVVDCIQAGLVPYVQSSPGTGKSAIMQQIADEYELSLIDHRLSTSDPTDLSGLPHFKEGKASFAPFSELFPIQDSVIPEGKNGWMLFLDEFNSAHRSVQAAAYKLILDKAVGQYPLHKNVVITAAGNLSTDRAITNPLSTAMQSRVIHLEMQVKFSDWLEDIGLRYNYDERIIAFLNQYPSKLMDFNPEHKDKTFCCPRTWEFVNKLIKNKNLDDSYAILLGGTITSGVAAEFIQFSKVYKDLVSINTILNDPENCRIPEDNSLKWATITHLMEKIDKDNFSKLGIYADRFSIDFRLLFYRAVLIKQPDLREHAAFSKAMSTLAKYLYD